MRKPGFTLVEMVIVLGVMVMIITLTGPTACSGFQQWQQRIFWKDFKQEWQLAQVRAQSEEQSTLIRYDMEQRQVSFHANHRFQNITVPKSLKVRKSVERVMHAGGYIQPATWEFIDTINHQEIDVKIQMAGGGYRIEKKRVHLR